MNCPVDVIEQLFIKKRQADVSEVNQLRPQFICQSVYRKNESNCQFLISNQGKG
jgi:hypothetical protein